MNACALAINFVNAGFDVVIVDVLIPETLTIYRDSLDRPLVSPLSTQRRAAAR